MAAVRQYIITVTASAIICSIISSFTQEKVIGNKLKLLCNLFLAVIVLEPITDLRIPELKEIPGLSLHEAEYAVSIGSELSANSMENIICEKAEAYIIDKAASLGLSVQAKVKIKDESNPIPESVIISGYAPDNLKEYLQNVIEQELAITKENQIWSSKRE